jgi:GTP-binding protein HflX
VSRLGASGERKNLIFVDTVGVIRRLPHNLVDAFRSTLEEAAEADILVHVLDAADPARKEHEATVMAVLGELGAGEIPLVTALNKADLLGAERETLAGEFPGAAFISAKNREGLGELWNLLEKKLKF